MNAPGRQRVGDLIAPFFEAVVAPLGFAEDDKSPGVLVAATVAGQRYYFQYGRVPVSDGGDAAPEEVVMLIGSNTKVFTATLLAMAVLQSRVELTTPVARLLPPEVSINEFAADEPVRLWHLATHSAGFPKGPCASGRYVFGHYGYDDTTRFLRDFQPRYRPGEYWFYSNQGFALLGALMSHVHSELPRSEPGWDASYRVWPQVTRRLILEPLGMGSTQVELGPVRRRLARSYDFQRAGQPYSRIDVGEIDPASAAVGAGALSSTLPDMLDFLERQIEPGPDVLGRAIALTQQETERELRMGLGWQIGDGYLCKDGLMLGYASYMAVDPTHRIGLFAFANSWGGDQGGSLNRATRAALGALRHLPATWQSPRQPDAEQAPDCPVGVAVDG
ncbi:beta-lactamase family protein [Lysobacter sp. K5869]|uniref:serine hydrolase domain-containing protein n=1 Tax=Lysobacter sp. K5869 TaxID=2820808 RepID=UPI001C061818|nr:serine hydrolase domain-containing protein [Lysobacter sp. K5869]QWP76524.1 beta-lactamase family protein [Lysobacter sp. K5869]